MKIVYLLAALLYLAPSLPADPLGSFRILGPGGGGAMFHPTISPHDEKTVLVACDMTGSYITRDGGRSWRMFNLRGPVHFFVFDPIDRQVIYAQADGLWRSNDLGETWRLVYPAASTLRGVRMSSDHADETLLADPDPLGEITALAIDPFQSQILYAAALQHGVASLFRSTDYGQSWIRLQSLAEPAIRMWAVASSPKSPPRLYVVCGHSTSQLFHGTLHSSKSPSPEAITDASLGSIGSAGYRLFVVAGGAAYVSVDGGADWHRCVLPGTTPKISAVATSSRDANVAYLGYEELRLNGKSWMGVARTDDGGQSWKLVWQEADVAAPNVHDAWITPAFGNDWGGVPLALAVAPRNPDLCYVTDLGRTMRSADGGKSWYAVYSRRIPNAGWQTTGLDVTTSYGIHFDPFNSQRQFITYTDIGLFRSDDAGFSWTSSIAGVPREWRNTTYWLEFDPAVKGRMWSAFSYTHDLPRPKMWRHTSPSTFVGGVCRSDDGGKSWQACKTGMPESAVTDVLLDPASPVSHRTLYATAFGRGVFKSTNGGQSWQLRNNGIQQREPFAWRMVRASDSTLYLVLARRSEHGHINDAGDGALYRSTDGAETWSVVHLPAPVNGPNGVAVDPLQPSRLYLAAWARESGEHGEGGGVYRSDDAGKTWRCVLPDDQHVYDVTIDPANPNNLYAAGFESSVWRSSDRGDHWQRIPGFRFKWAHRVILDPRDRSMIYITTFGGSVWHGPINDSAAPADIATPQLR